MSGISIETFMGADQTTRDKLIFELLTEIRDKQVSQIAKCEPRIKKLENNKWWDNARAATGGFIGGIIAVIGKGFMGK